jgi:pyruvate dehydrogenase E2 component (dihydrolipoamide acetyltransferase)
MSTEIKLPSLGEGIESGDVLEILVSVGDMVKKEQSLLEMETDKATVSVPSPIAGKVLSIAVKEGQTVPVGSVIVTLEAVGISASPAPAAAVAPAVSAPAPAVEPAPAAPAPTAPAPVASAPTAPVPAAVAAVAPPRQIPVAAPISVPPAIAAPVASTASTGSGTPFADDVIPAGPAIRRFAREVGVDLSEVQGSGDGGRITRDDVLTVVRHANQSAKATPAATTPPASVAAPSAAEQSISPKSAAKASLPGTAATDDYGPIRVDRMTKIRKTIAAQMH